MAYKSSGMSSQFNAHTYIQYVCSSICFPPSFKSLGMRLMITIVATCTCTSSQYLLAQTYITLYVSLYDLYESSYILSLVQRPLAIFLVDPWILYYG